jgi:hypothetical protein
MIPVNCVRQLRPPRVPSSKIQEITADHQKICAENTWKNNMENLSFHGVTEFAGARAAAVVGKAGTT